MLLPIGIVQQQSAGAGGGAAIVLDTFTDADAAPLQSHTPDTYPSTGWTVGGGSITISSNEALLNAISSYFIESGLSDCAVSCDIKYSVNNYADLCFRRSGSNFWMVEIGQTPYNVVKLYEMPAATLRGTGSTVLSSGTFYTIKVVCSGTSITVSVDGGADEISYTSSTYLTQTQHGIRAYTSGNRYDNFKVESL